MSRVLVAMSGGVDSSVAAALLVEQGHEVIGVTMKTFCYSDVPAHGKTCCGLDGIMDAKRVADTLGIPHYVFDVEEDFTRDVIDDFVAEYARGRTPNPCVRCNSNTKFRDLLTRGEALGCDRIATGHYVRVQHGVPQRGSSKHVVLSSAPEHTSDGGETALLRGLDDAKDQSYFLWGLPASMLPKLLFPVGELTKQDVRDRARSLELVTAEKPESQEICFVPTGDYRDLLRTRLGPVHPALEPGAIVRSDGAVIGEHAGYAGFTVGQRRGLGGGFTEPMFVLGVRPETREVVVGTREELMGASVTVRELNWLTAPPDPGARLRVQLRYRAPTVTATVLDVGEELRLTLREAQPAITPGQSAVVFEGDRVLGGGRIA